MPFHVPRQEISYSILRRATIKTTTLGESQIDGDVLCNGQIIFSHDCNIKGNIKCKSIGALGNISVYGYIETNESIIAMGFIKVSKYIEAGGFIEVGDSIEAGERIEANGFIWVDGHIYAGGSVQAGTTIFARKFIKTHLY